MPKYVIEVREGDGQVRYVGLPKIGPIVMEEDRHVMKVENPMVDDIADAHPFDHHRAAETFLDGCTLSARERAAFRIVERPEP